MQCSFSLRATKGHGPLGDREGAMDEEFTKGVRGVIEYQMEEFLTNTVGNCENGDRSLVIGSHYAENPAFNTMIYFE